MPLDPAKIETHMAARKLSRAAMARVLKMSPPNLSRILTGKRTDPTLSTAERLAGALGCTIEDISTPTPDPDAVGALPAAILVSDEVKR